MATRPTLERAVPNTNITADMWNGNFDKIMQYADDTLEDAKDYVEGYMPQQTGQAGKFLSTDGTTANWATIDMSNKANTDGSNITEAFATKLVNSWGSKFTNPAFPNFSEKIQLTVGLEATAETNGYVYYYGGGGTKDASKNAQITIDGVVYPLFSHYSHYGDTSTDNYDGGFIPMKVGSVYKVTGNINVPPGGSPRLFFIPCT